ncbi:MAG TPA: hypothetical protein ENH10_04415 [Bacteroidetes bacterium]|nr:hypothetical protein [Bacteroidota bacterium]HEX04383.1 hypothetical protein [Bacteroidota bacterium]
MRKTHDILLTEIWEVKSSLEDELMASLKSGRFDGYGYLQVYTDFLRWVSISLFEWYTSTSAMKGSVAMLMSGSMARGTAKPGSDLDLVILEDGSSSIKVTKLKQFIIDSLDWLGFGNSDVVICNVNGKVLLPDDVIDQRIASTGRYLAGSMVLAEIFAARQSWTRDFVLEETAMNEVFRNLGTPSGSSLEYKYIAGGQRDAVRLFDGVRMLRRCGVSDSHDVRLAAILAVSKGAEVQYQVHGLDKETLTRVLEARYELIAMITASSVSDTVAIFEELRVRLEKQCYLSEKELLKILRLPGTKWLRALALAMTQSAALDTLAGSIDLPVGVRLFALSANPFASANLLDELARLPGYKWRNIRDQVIKNPAIGEETLRMLATNRLQVTRMRARAELIRRGVNCTYSED